MLTREQTEEVFNLYNESKQCSKCGSGNCEKRFSLSIPLTCSLVCLDCGNIDEYILSEQDYAKMVQRAQARTYLNGFSKEELVEIILKGSFGEEPELKRREK